MKRGANSGFTLLEAIVALTILSGGLLAAFAWFDRGIQALIKIDDTALEQSAINEALERLTLEDFRQATSGEYRWREYRIVWDATLTEPPREGKNTVGSQGYFDLSFYRVSLILNYRGREITDTTVYIFKHQLVREPPLRGL